MELDAYKEMAATEDRHWWFRGRRQVLESLLEGLALPSDAEILEIGSGTGGNLDLLQRFGRVKAVEMNDYAREFARERQAGRIPILAGSLPGAIPIAEASQDLICLFDVLEHVAEDQAALATIRRLLRPTGRLLLTVPAHGWLWSRHDEYLHHQRRYSRQQLRHQLMQAGLRPERLTYFNSLLSPLVVAGRIADRLRPGRAVAGTEVPPSWINEPLRTMFAAEHRILRHFDLPFGISLLALARPS